MRMTFVSNIFETLAGTILDTIGTRDEIAESNGNITVYNVIDKQSGAIIGQGVMMIRDGMYVLKNLNESSTLRKQVMEKLNLKGGE